MALRVVTVKSSGGDYSSLNAAFVGELGDLTAGGLDRQLEIACGTFLDATLADTGAAGWTTDATHFVTIRAADNHRGLVSASDVQRAYTNAQNVTVSVGYSVVIGLTALSSANWCFFAGDIAGPVRFERCIANGTATCNNGFATETSGGVLWINCLAVGPYPLGGFSASPFTNSNKPAVAYNCTSVGGAHGFAHVSTVAFAAVNCLASNNASGGFTAFVGGVWTGSGNCASADSTSPSSGAGHRIGQSFEFVNSAALDYHLSVDDAAAKRFGADLSADATYAFSTDIDGDTRSGTWDIGADQYKLVAATTWALNDIAPLSVDQTFAAPASATGFGPDIAPLSLTTPFSAAASPFSQRVDFAPLGMLLLTPTTGVTALPGVGALTLTGFAPVIASSIGAGVGALTLTGFAASVVLGTVEYPGVGVLTLTGFAPAVVLGTVEYPGVGVLTLTGFAPILASTLAANVGALTLTGFAPVLASTLNAGVGALTLTGFAASVVVGTVEYPGVGVLTLTGFAPAVVLGTVEYPGVGVLTLTGFAPSVVAGTVEYPGAGTLTLTGFAPVLAATIAADVGSLILTGFAPALASTIVADVGTLTLTGFAPSVVVGTVIYPDAGALTISGFAPSVVIGTVVYPDTGALVLDGFAPTMGNQTVEPGVGALVLDGFAPTLASTIAADVGALTIDGFEPTVVIAPLAPVDVFPDVGTLTIDGFAPDVIVASPSRFSPPGAPTVHYEARPGTGALSLEGFAPDLVRSDNQIVAPGRARIRLVGFAPTVIVTTNDTPAPVPIPAPIARRTKPPAVAPTRRPVATEPPKVAPKAAPVAPRIPDAVVVDALLGSLALEGFAASVVVRSPVRISPATGALTFAGFAPDVAIALAPETIEADDDMITIAALYHAFLNGAE